jgi:hypothetical protein
MNNEEKIDELLEVITKLGKQVSWLLERLSFYEDILKKYRLTSLSTIDEKEIEIYSKRWEEQKKEEGGPFEG